MKSRRRVNSNVGLLFIAMVKEEGSSITKFTWLQRSSLVLAVVWAGLLAVQCWRWAKGHGHWSDVLTPLSFLTLGLATVTAKKRAHLVLQFIGVCTLVAAIIVLAFYL
jgi:hypothetical protein